MSKDGCGCIGRRISGEESRLKYPLVLALVVFIAVPASLICVRSVDIIVKEEGCLMSKNGCGCVGRRMFLVGKSRLNYPRVATLAIFICVPASLMCK